ncbi:hypothetical protein Tco_0098481 [Tanacetum coccineum]
MPLANHASTSANPNPAISPAFVEANYEVLESLIRERKRQMHNEDLCTELEYYSEEQRGRVIEFEEAPNRDGSKVERESEVRSPSKQRAEGNENCHQSLNNSGGNLPPNGTHLSYNAPSFIPNNIQPSSVQIPTYANPYPQPNAVMTYGQPSSYFSYAQGSTPSFEGVLTFHSYGGYVSQAPMSNHGPTPNGSTYPPNAFPNSYPFYTQPINPLPNAPIYPSYGPTGLFANSTGCVTLFVRWIEDNPLPDGLKMPSHVGSYDGKGDPDNYLHLFEGAIRMQKWAMPVAYHMFTYTLKDST